MQTLIFGAGKTGRGLCAQLCQRAGWAFTLVDSDAALVALLNQQETQLQILNQEAERIALPTRALQSDDAVLVEVAMHCDLWFTAVFGENLGQLGADMRRLLQQRCRQGAGAVHIITCENQVHAAALLREACLNGVVDEQLIKYIQNQVHFVEGMVLKTCIYGVDKTVILAQDFYRLPCDGDAFAATNGEKPDSHDLDFLPQFEHQLQRKIYTYNAINAVISYLGHAAGYEMLSEAAHDPAIKRCAEAAAQICNTVLINEFGFDSAEQEEWSRGAMEKFLNPIIPDPLTRNVAAVRRKLGREDRIVGPALLALHYGLEIEPFVRTVVAALHYFEKGSSLLQECNGDAAACMLETAGLEAAHPLVHAVVQLNQDQELNQVKKQQAQALTHD